MPRYNPNTDAYTIYDMAEVDPPTRKLSAAQILRAVEEAYDCIWESGRGPEDGDYIYIQFLLGAMVSRRKTHVEMHWGNPVVGMLMTLPICHPVWRYVVFNTALKDDEAEQWNHYELKGYEDP